MGDDEAEDGKKKDGTKGGEDRKDKRPSSVEEFQKFLDMSSHSQQLGICN